jgi:hypothetical protein
MILTSRPVLLAISFADLQCSGKVNLKDIFDGDVEQSMTNLHESIQCGVAWKNIFEVCDLFSCLTALTRVIT